VEFVSGGGHSWLLGAGFVGRSVGPDQAGEKAPSVVWNAGT
jgi:hypothetical protein